jgi:hypothetical protein
MSVDQIQMRTEILEALGTAEERRALRRKLGLSRRDVASMTGLSEDSVRRRETEEWQHLRGSLDSEGGLRYVRLIAAARGITLNVESTSSSEGRARAPAATA